MKKLFIIVLFLTSVVVTPWWVPLIVGLVLVIVFRAYVSVLVGVLLFDILFASQGAVAMGFLSFSTTAVVIVMVATYTVRARLLE